MPYYESSRRPAPGEYKRMGFLIDFLALKGVNYAQAAALLNIQRPLIYNAMLEDDMNLSRAEQLIDILGYELDIYMTKDLDEVLPSDKVIDSSNFVHTPTGYRLKRLAFLWLAVERYGMSKVALAKAIGLAVTTVSKWYQIDDIKVSRIFQCAQALGLSVKFVIRPKKETTEAELKAAEGKRVSVVDIHQTKTVPLED